MLTCNTNHFLVKSTLSCKLSTLVLAILILNYLSLSLSFRLRAQYPDESRLRTAISSHSTSAILACLPTTTTAGTNGTSTPMPIMGFSRSSVTDTVVETIVQGCLSVRVTQGEMLTKDATDSSLHRSYRVSLCM